MDIKRLDSILKAVANTGVRKLKLDAKGVKLRMVCNSGFKSGKTEVKRELAMTPPPLDIKTFENLPESTFGTQESSAGSKEDICSDFIGFFSRFNKKTKKQYVKLRDIVKKDEIIGTVTSMHVAHDILASKDGKIVEILIEEGQPVGYGQPLVRLENK